MRQEIAIGQTWEKDNEERFTIVKINREHITIDYEIWESDAEVKIEEFFTWDMKRIFIPYPAKKLRIIE